MSFGLRYAAWNSLFRTDCTRILSNHVSIESDMFALSLATIKEF